MRGATLAPHGAGENIFISIHAPRAGGDLLKTRPWSWESDFNPRPPCGGRRTNSALCCSMFEFQSTPPVRGATRLGIANLSAQIFQSTPPVRGATLQGLNAVALSPFQSTPPVRGATGITKAGTAPNVFQSTPPVRGATKRHSVSSGGGGISIHAPRAGGDLYGVML